MPRFFQQCNIINQFLHDFKIIQHCNESTVISSENNTYLIRNIQIEGQNNQNIKQIVQTLTQHQQFNSKNIYTLLDFQIIHNKNKNQSIIRAIYQYGLKSLEQQILKRNISNQYFQQDSLWGLLYSLATPLEYLQSKNIIYGVIDASRIFLDKNVSLLDPSSTAIDPYLISQNRLYSPQLLNQERQIQNIDMFKSDVYVLGLLMLQSALLKTEINQINQNFVQTGLQQIQSKYSEQFKEILSRMLSFYSQQRPSFKQILKSLSDMFQISTIQIQNLQPMKLDTENYSNSLFSFQQGIQQQKFDIRKHDNRYQENSIFQQLTDYEKAQIKFLQLNVSNQQSSRLNNLSIDLSEENSYCIENIMMKSFQKNRKVLKSREIKQKLVKNQQFYYHSDRDQLNYTTKKGHKRSHTNIQKDIEQINQGKVHFFYQNNPKINDQKNRTQIYLNHLQNNKNEEKNKQNKGKFVNNNFKNMNFNQSQQIKCSNKENLFTKPEIMNMIKLDIERIQKKRKKNQKIVK